MSGVNNLANQQANIAKAIFGESSPLRQSLTASMMSALGVPITKPTTVLGKNGKPAKGDKNSIGNVDLTGAYVIPGLFGATPAERQAIEAQFNVAKENTLGMAPSRGSALNRNITDINIARAADVSGLTSAEKQRALSMASGVAYNTPPQAMSGLQGATNNLMQVASLQNSYAQQQNAGKAGKGAALGKLGSAGASQLGGLMLCWIAAELYGEGSDEFYLARHAIFVLWDTPLAHAVQRFYLRYGKRIAAFLHCHPVFKPLIRPLFDLAVAKARGELCHTVSQPAY